MAFDPSMLDAEGSFSSLRGAPPSVSSTSSPGSNAYSLQNSATPATVVDHEKSSSPEQTSATNGASGADGRKDSTVPAACLACRSKHLKCDGQTPCARCLSTQSECVYVASRRGYKGPRRGVTPNPNKRQATSPPELSGSSECPMLLGAGGQSSSAASSNMSTVIGSNFAPPSMAQGVSQDVQLASSMEPPSDGQLYKSYCDATGTDPTAWAISASHSSLITNSSAASQEGKYLDSFYHHFHASHPFVLPKAFLLQVAKEGTIKPLLAAIWWLGSIYIDVNSGTRERLLNQAYELLYDSGQPRDAFVVQAMMLMIVGLDGNCQQEKARVLLGEAETLALKIGLNTREFATEHGRGIPVVEESWRRTWWDLFIIDGMIAGVHRQTNFLLYDIPAGAGLPCEEDQYLSTRIPIPLYLEDMEDQFFSDDDREFSSFAYRVQCGRNLGKMMRTPPMFGPDDENLAKIETLLTNWRLHLPASKRDALQKNGKLDEMMFQAHMMNQATSIMLHQPHSQLDSSATQDINSCAPHQMIPSGDLFNKHTRHTVESANTISNMITHRVPLLSHTHFFTCVITLSSIVHLSRWALIFIPHDDDDLRQKIRLNIGALNRLSEVWGAADRARGQVKAVAQEIYKVKKQQRDSSEYWLGLSQQEITNTITTDDSIISEFDTFQPMPSTLLN